MADPIGYKTLDNAAAASLMLLQRQPNAAAQEYMGLIYQDPTTGLFYHTPFQTQGKRDTSSYHGGIPGKLAAIAHNHPAQRTGDHYRSDRFSIPDVNTAIGMHVPSYIVAMPDASSASRTGEARRYDPRPSHKGHSNAGDAFLAEFPIEEFLQAIAQRNPLTASYLANRPSANPLLAAK